MHHAALAKAYLVLGGVHIDVHQPRIEPRSPPAQAGCAGAQEQARHAAANREANAAAMGQLIADRVAITWDDTHEYRITGVFELPTNTHFPCHWVASVKTVSAEDLSVVSLVK